MDTSQGQGGELEGVGRRALSRSGVVLVVVLPLAVACWQAGRGEPLGMLALGFQVAVVALLVVCEYALAFETSWGSTVRGRLTDFLYAGAAATIAHSTKVPRSTRAAAPA